mgnify:CR=1 FL=1
MEAEVGYVNIFVKDFDRAVAFYRDTLGLELRFADADFGYASFATGGAGLSLAHESEETGALAGRFTGVGLVVADLDATYRELTGKGVEFVMPPTAQPWGGTLALMKDSEGNVLYLDPGGH